MGLGRGSIQYIVFDHFAIYPSPYRPFPHRISHHNFHVPHATHLFGSKCDLHAKSNTVQSSKRCPFAATETRIGM